MHSLKQHSKRILTDAGGYGLILVGILTGWLPGPTGIPLILAGLAVLSINNKWAKDLREYLLQHGGKLVGYLFPKHKLVQLLYDGLVLVLLGIVALLAWDHDPLWKVSLAVTLFAFSVFVALMNRDRLKRLRGRA